MGLPGQLVVTLALFGLCVLLIVRLDGVGMRRLAGPAIVHDGDTLTLAGERIRLAGIDAFEIDQTCRRNGVDYACGESARMMLARLAGASAVSCEGKRRDRYQRLLAVCMAGGSELNRALVSAGWAVSYGAYRVDEILARMNGQGAWAGEFVTPAEWRAGNGRPAETRHDIVSRMLEALWRYLF